jgi:hypothetical protein
MGCGELVRTVDQGFIPGITSTKSERALALEVQVFGIRAYLRA